jgi:hypothetical protein
MAVTHDATVRNAIADAVDDQVNSGSTDATGDLILRASTTTLVTIPFQNPAFGSAASGVITLAGVPLTAAATAGGTADNFIIRNRDNNSKISGSVTATGGGGDMTIDNTNIANSQNVQLNSLTWTAPS